MLNYEKKFSCQDLTKDDEDVGREFKDTQQELLFELKIKTDRFLKKLKEQTKKNRVKFE